MNRSRAELNRVWNGLRTYATYWVATGREISMTYGKKIAVGAGIVSGLGEGALLYSMPLAITSFILIATDHGYINPYVGSIPIAAFTLLRGVEAYLGTLHSQKNTKMNSSLENV